MSIVAQSESGYGCWIRLPPHTCCWSQWSVYIYSLCQIMVVGQDCPNTYCQSQWWWWWWLFPGIRGLFGKIFDESVRNQLAHTISLFKSGSIHSGSASTLLSNIPWRQSSVDHNKVSIYTAWTGSWLFDKTGPTPFADHSNVSTCTICRLASVWFWIRLPHIPVAGHNKGV